MCWLVCWRETSMTVNGLYVCLQRLFESNNNDITKKLSDVWSLYLHAYELVKMDYKTDLVVSYCITGWNKLSKHQTTLNRINSGNCSCWHTSAQTSISNLFTHNSFQLTYITTYLFWLQTKQSNCIVKYSKWFPALHKNDGYVVKDKRRLIECIPKVPTSVISYNIVRTSWSLQHSPY